MKALISALALLSFVSAYSLPAYSATPSSGVSTKSTKHKAHRVAHARHHATHHAVHKATHKTHAPKHHMVHSTSGASMPHKAKRATSG